jgi:ectoine hydroxylase-related dioxygenase (phytanoyl-CoA dioxygenase family)
MIATELTQQALEARDLAADYATTVGRIEAYRTREPAAAPRLLIDETQQEPAAAWEIPEINATDLTAQCLAEAVAQHGSLIVRNLFPQSSINTLINCADHVIDACEMPAPADLAAPNTYFNPPSNLADIMPNRERELGNTRNFHRESGSAMCIEAPVVAESLLALYEAHGLKNLITEYLGEAPCLTVKKWVLRRSKLPVAEAGWHQDGAFMGTAINSINMWLPLNECGGETGAPGMDVVPQRLYDIASADGAQFNWSVSDSQVSGGFGGSQPVAPVFNAGDAFFFDHFFLHRTQHRTDFSKIRYAVETWFFGETNFPKNQIPLAW